MKSGVSGKWVFAIIVIVVLSYFAYSQGVFKAVGLEVGKPVYYYEAQMGAYCCEATDKTGTLILNMTDGIWTGVYTGAQSGTVSFLNANIKAGGCPGWIGQDYPYFKIYKNDMLVADSYGTSGGSARTIASYSGFGDGDKITVVAMCRGIGSDYNSTSRIATGELTFGAVRLYNYVDGTKLTLTETGLSCTDQINAVQMAKTQPSTTTDLQKIWNTNSYQTTGNIVFDKNVARVDLGQCIPYVYSYNAKYDPLGLNFITYQGKTAKCSNKQIYEMIPISVGTEQSQYNIRGQTLGNVQCCVDADCVISSPGTSCDSNSFTCVAKPNGKGCQTDLDCSSGYYKKDSISYYMQGSCDQSKPQKDYLGTCSFTTSEVKCTPSACEAQSLFCKPDVGCVPYISPYPLPTTQVPATEFNEKSTSGGGGLGFGMIMLIVIGVIIFISAVVIIMKSRKGAS